LNEEDKKYGNKERVTFLDENGESKIGGFEGSIVCVGG